jgi:hypothetical protein
MIVDTYLSSTDRWERERLLTLTGQVLAPIDANMWREPLLVAHTEESHRNGG